MSKRLVEKMKRRDFTDKLLVGLGLTFFFFVVIYIVQRRIF